MKKIVAAATLCLAFSTTALAQEVNVQPTRYLQRISIPGFGIGYPGTEQASVLDQGKFIIDVGAEQTLGIYSGLLPNLELGIQGGGSGIGVVPRRTDLGLTAKLQLPSFGPARVALMGRTRFTRTESQPGGINERTWHWIGVPFTFGNPEGTSFDLMPLTEINSGGLSAPPGLNIGLKLQLAPSLFLLASDWIAGYGATQDIAGGLRYRLSPQASIDIHLVDSRINTGAPGFQLGTFGIVASFGGSR